MANISTNDFKPQLVGRGLWNSIHQHAARAVDSSTADLYHAKWAVSGTINDLVCAECRSHATEYMKEYPIDMLTATELLDWTFKMHESVNNRIGKTFKVDIEQLRAFYLAKPTCEDCHPRKNGPLVRPMGLPESGIPVGLFSPTVYRKQK